MILTGLVGQGWVCASDAPVRASIVVAMARRKVFTSCLLRVFSVGDVTAQPFSTANAFLAAATPIFT